ESKKLSQYLFPKNKSSSAQIMKELENKIRSSDVHGSRNSFPYNESDLLWFKRVLDTIENLALIDEELIAIKENSMASAMRSIQGMPFVNPNIKLKELKRHANKVKKKFEKGILTYDKLQSFLEPALEFTQIRKLAESHFSGIIEFNVKNPTMPTKTELEEYSEDLSTKVYDSIKYGKVLRPIFKFKQYINCVPIEHEKLEKLILKNFKLLHSIALCISSPIGSPLYSRFYGYSKEVIDEFNAVILPYLKSRAVRKYYTN